MKTCPIRLIGSYNREYAKCIGESCEWFNDEEKKCSICLLTKPEQEQRQRAAQKKREGKKENDNC